MCVSYFHLPPLPTYLAPFQSPPPASAHFLWSVNQSENRTASSSLCAVMWHPAGRFKNIFKWMILLYLQQKAPATVRRRGVLGWIKRFEMRMEERGGGGQGCDQLRFHLEWKELGYMLLPIKRKLVEVDTTTLTGLESALVSYQQQAIKPPRTLRQSHGGLGTGPGQQAAARWGISIVVFPPHSGQEAKVTTDPGRAGEEILSITDACSLPSLGGCLWTFYLYIWIPIQRLHTTLFFCDCAV